MLALSLMLGMAAHAQAWPSAGCAPGTPGCAPSQAPKRFTKPSRAETLWPLLADPVCTGAFERCRLEHTSPPDGLKVPSLAQQTVPDDDLDLCVAREGGGVATSKRCRLTNAPELVPADCNTLRAGCVDVDAESLLSHGARRYLDASDIDVGNRFRLGVGVAIGFPPSASVRWMFNVNHAMSFHLAPTVAMTGLHLRVQYEQRVKKLAGFLFGRLDLTWNIGLTVSVPFGQEATAARARPGIFSGIGVELTVFQAPAAVFVELSPVLYPLDLVPATASNFLPVGVIGVIGGRWYFDVGPKKASKAY